MLMKFGLILLVVLQVSALDDGQPQPPKDNVPMATKPITVGFVKAVEEEMDTIPIGKEGAKIFKERAAQLGKL